MGHQLFSFALLSGLVCLLQTGCSGGGTQSPQNQNSVPICESNCDDRLDDQNGGVSVPTPVPTSGATSTPVTEPSPAPESTATPMTMESMAPTAEPKVVYAINAGGPRVVVDSGQVFEGDGYSAYAQSYSTDETIGGTEDDVLFQTEAWGDSFTYQLPVTNEIYTVTLYFAEIFFDQIDARSLSVYIEGERYIDSLDLVSEVGANQAYHYVVEDVQVSDGALSIDIEGQNENAKISAILVESKNGQRQPRQFNAGMDSIPFSKAGNRPVLRIPGIIKTSTGRIFAGIEARESGSDHSEKEVVIVQSDDGGKTWQNQTILGDKGSSPTGNPTFVFDDDTQRLFLFYAAYDGTEGTASNLRVYYRYSDSHGHQWSDEQDITDLMPDEYFLALPGPGHGIQLKNANAGRLLVPFWGNQPGYSSIFGVYSDDHGETWKIGYHAKSGEADAYHPNEHQVIEQQDGDVLIIARTARTATEFAPGMVRAKAISKDGGVTMSPLSHSSQFSGPVCMGSVITIADRVIYSSPLNPDGRSNLGIRDSFNDGQSWGFPKQLTSGAAAYSDMVALDENTIGILIEVNGSKDLIFRTFDTSESQANWIQLDEKSAADTPSFLVVDKQQNSTAAIVDDGKFGKGVYLDGHAHVYVSKTDDTYLADSDFTLNFWALSDNGFSGEEALLWFYTLGSARDGMWLRILPSYLRALVNTGTERIADYNTNFAEANQWRMITIARTGTTLNMYVDGQGVISEGNFFTGEFGENTDIGYIFGQRPNNRADRGFVQGFHGKLDEIKLYKRSLSMQEIQTLENNGLVDQQGLVVDISF